MIYFIFDFLPLNKGLILLKWVECGSLAVNRCQKLRVAQRIKNKKMEISKSDVKSFVKANFLHYNITVRDS